MTKLHWLRAVLATALLFLSAPLHAKTLRVTMHSDLKIVDPIWTSALITTYHGYMIYDTLFGLDEKLNVQPQMVEKYTLSDDKLTWTFVLRDGLAFHDGAPVTAEDCVASLKRWSARDAMGQKMMSFVSTLVALDPKTIRMTMREPYGLVLQTLGKPGSNVPFIMPKRVAETDPNKQIDDLTGSGPFIFKRDEWRPGEKVVYLKSANYKPRAEPPSGAAGGKVVKVDRVEWLWIADTQTQINALLGNEIDILEQPPLDLIPLLESDKSVGMKVVNASGRQYAFRFNTLFKPFDNPKIRQAATYALNQTDMLKATIGDAKWYRECRSVFPCGSAFETTKGWDDRLSSNFEKSKALLKEAGYDGTPVVLMQSTDNAYLANMAPVAKQLLERGGFKVDLQAMDWQTLVSRRAKRDAPAQGGWNAFFTSWSSAEVLDPISTQFLNAGCEKATFGWPCDPEMEKLRDAFSRETDPDKQKAVAEAVALRMAEMPTHIHSGQYLQPTAFRKNIVGLLGSPSFALWNVEIK
ncbi:glutathione-binding protein GsiB precursor [Variibacter gotjawalensis]|uniref:Glutathione-binding protein GsiB n=1 Tax=Variibacter gotjawalensis TaxID=1333996 RepID=A0A0S3PZI0_9BRAD|nr:ABC transporter substrate-binding protein [Variibacter gotjawalensis]NIK47137.1 peptide/nickel transport system substrate-binding protein [Variibacter gotjawalensis]RZS49037.1 peptide/nickel transport system substrate-binding protein [Variibacter gotjawalensis]BAT61299.1 glutathione-binding protein GsiB precursor [Variibacter gotjawalensis]